MFDRIRRRKAASDEDRSRCGHPLAEQGSTVTSRTESKRALGSPATTIACGIVALVLIAWNLDGFYASLTYPVEIPPTANPPPRPYVNPPPTAPSPVCTRYMRSKISTQLAIPMDSKQPSNNAEFNKNTTMFKRNHWAFRCPETSWLDDFYTDEESGDIGSPGFLGINVGCNKGHDAIRTGRMGLRSEAFDAVRWREHWHKKVPAGRNKTQDGLCHQGASSQIDLKGSNLQRPRHGEMHCIEPMPRTFMELKRASEAFGLGEDSGLVLQHAAIASAPGTVLFPGTGNNGRENIGIDYCQHNTKARMRHGCVEVPVYSLEGYVDKFVKDPQAPVNVLRIDVEGWDFDVLFGASAVLDRTHYLEFEYHSKGPWKHLHIADAVRLLDGKGFTCYWAGPRALWRITGCYFDFYDRWHQWTNVACVHRSQNRLADRMETLFLETLDNDDVFAAGETGEGPA